MKVTILGAGTCGNIPGVNDQMPPGFLVEFGGEHLLLDCSELIRLRLTKIGFDYGNIKHIAITHAHQDHCALAHFVQSHLCVRTWTNRKTDVDIHVYCPTQIAENFKSVWNFHLPGKKERLLPFAKLNFHPLSNTNQTCKIGSGVLSARNVYHSYGEVDSLAFRLETPEGILAYTGDSGDCPGLREAAQDADLLITEASARIGDNIASSGYGHMSPADVGRVASESDVKKVVLVHYTSLDSDADMIADCRSTGYKGEIVVGKDFQVHEIK